MTASTYDHPLPVLELDTTSLTLDANSSGGTFIVKNGGGGLLAGFILSRCLGLTFSPSSWEGNSQIIEYKFSQHQSQSASIIETHAVISTTGGEFLLPVTINTSPMIIYTEEGSRITSVADFYSYARDYPAAARRLFTSSEFYMLLISTGYPYLEVYESLHKDPNRERAMDNFFHLSSLKGKTTLSLETNHMDIIQHPTEVTQSYLYVQKSDNGYADAPITAHKGSPWLALNSTRLTTADYDHENKAPVGIKINPGLMPSPFVKEQIQVGTEVLTLAVRLAPSFALRLNKEGFRYEDRGIIEVENNTGFDMTVDVHSRDRHVRFFRASYTAPRQGGPLSIPFEIRPSAFFGTRRIFRRLPYISTYVDVRARCPAQEYRKRLYLNIGEW